MFCEYTERLSLYTFSLSELYSKLGDYGHLLESYLHMASTYDTTPRRSLEVLEEARKLCHIQFGELNDTMIRILLKIALAYECRLSQYESAEVYYRKWAELTASVYGEAHPSAVLAREQVADFLAGHGKQEQALVFRESLQNRHTTA